MELTGMVTGPTCDWRPAGFTDVVDENTNCVWSEDHSRMHLLVCPPGFPFWCRCLWSWLAKRVRNLTDAHAVQFALVTSLLASRSGASEWRYPLPSAVRSGLICIKWTDTGTPDLASSVQAGMNGWPIDSRGSFRWQGLCCNCTFPEPVDGIYGY